MIFFILSPYKTSLITINFETGYLIVFRSSPYSMPHHNNKLKNIVRQAGSQREPLSYFPPPVLCLTSQRSPRLRDPRRSFSGGNVKSQGIGGKKAVESIGAELRTACRSQIDGDFNLTTTMKSLILIMTRVFRMEH
jgi:hypothetical protein